MKRLIIVTSKSQDNDTDFAVRNQLSYYQYYVQLCSVIFQFCDFIINGFRNLGRC